MTETLLRLRSRSSTFAIGLTLALLVANIVALPAMVSLDQWPQTLASFAPFAVAAIASTPAILSGGGGIDISIGPLLTLANIVLVTALLPMGPLVAVPLVLLLGALVGAVNGVLVAVLRFQPVIVTLCVNFVLTGVNLKLLAQPKAAGSTWADGLANMIGPVPGALLTIGLPLLAWWLLGRTAYLKNLYAVGGDDVTAYSAGVNVAAVRILAYTVGGLLAGVAGLALTALTRSANAGLGMQYTLIAIVAVTVGGTSLAGGRGSLVGSLAGAACIFLIQNLLSALHVSSLWNQLVYGLLLLVAVILGARLRGGTK